MTFSEPIIIAAPSPAPRAGRGLVQIRRGHPISSVDTRSTGSGAMPSGTGGWRAKGAWRALAAAAVCCLGGSPPGAAQTTPTLNPYNDELLRLSPPAQA